MNNYLSRLNPAERRFVVGVAFLLFIVANTLWIWPHFADWGNLNRRREGALQTFANHQTTIDQANRLTPEMIKLKNEGGDVPAEDQSLQFLKTIQTQAAASGVSFLRNSSPRTTAGPFFIDQSQTISIQGGEKQMVDFLYTLGAGNSMIRVRSLSVRPDPARQQLSADITLMASYQKKKPAGAPAPVAKTAAPAAKTEGAVKPGNPPVAPAPVKTTDPKAPTSKTTPKNK